MRAPVSSWLLWLGAFVLYFGLSLALLPTIYNLGHWVPALRHWISDGELYVRLASTIGEACIAAATAAYIVRWCRRPLVLGGLLSIAMLASHGAASWPLLNAGLMSPASFIRAPLVALVMLWLALWFWFDLAGWGRRAGR